MVTEKGGDVPGTSPLFISSSLTSSYLPEGSIPRVLPHFIQCDVFLATQLVYPLAPVPLIARDIARNMPPKCPDSDLS
ncbi:hypothetical protein D9M69_683860 [compost metagenome]